MWLNFEGVRLSKPVGKRQIRYGTSSKRTGSGRALGTAGLPGAGVELLGRDRLPVSQGEKF